MSIKLTDIKNIATIIKTKYGGNLHHMNFVFCFKKSRDSYFIFQEIQGMPIKRIVYHESNNSVSLMASWSSWSNPFAMVADANFEKIANWKDLQDRSRPYNSYIEIDGGFNSINWKSVDKENKTEKKKKHKDKTDAFVEFRIDQIDKAVFNDDHFELYSPTISMVAFCSRHRFPYGFEDDGSEYEGVSSITAPVYPATSLGSHSISSPTIISWQGRSFNITYPVSDNSPYGEDMPLGSSLSSTIGGPIDTSSYWVKEESDEENREFDVTVANYFLEEREDDDGILDVGQREVDLYFDD